jgi:hypothetical protein
MAENKPEEQPKTQPKPASRHPDSVIWTRRNIILFIIVVVQGALILAGLIFVALLIFFPALRQRVLPSEDGAMITRSLTFSPIKGKDVSPHSPLLWERDHPDRPFASLRLCVRHCPNFHLLLHGSTSLRSPFLAHGHGGRAGYSHMFSAARLQDEVPVAMYETNLRCERFSYFEPYTLPRVFREKHGTSGDKALPDYP